MSVWNSDRPPAVDNTQKEGDRTGRTKLQLKSASEGARGNATGSEGRQGGRGIALRRGARRRGGCVHVVKGVRIEFEATFRSRTKCGRACPPDRPLFLHSMYTPIPKASLVSVSLWFRFTKSITSVYPLPGSDECFHGRCFFVGVNRSRWRRRTSPKKEINHEALKLASGPLRFLFGALRKNDKNIGSYADKQK